MPQIEARRKETNSDGTTEFVKVSLEELLESGAYEHQFWAFYWKTLLKTCSAGDIASDTTPVMLWAAFLEKIVTQQLCYWERPEESRRLKWGKSLNGRTEWCNQGNNMQFALFATSDKNKCPCLRWFVPIYLNKTSNEIGVVLKLPLGKTLKALREIGSAPRENMIAIYNHVRRMRLHHLIPINGNLAWKSIKPKTTLDVIEVTGNKAAGGGKSRHLTVEFQAVHMQLCKLSTVRELNKIEQTRANTVHKSAKFNLLFERLNEFVVNDRRILIFSQFVEVLRMIGSILNDLNIPFVELVGETPLETRARNVQAFQNGDVQIFLVSLFAGGQGLNLTKADTVILMEPWWNPAKESQAVDRAHRIGQKNKVSVFKMVAADTIEERILRLQEGKLAIAGSVLLSDEELLDAALTEEDLNFLLGKAEPEC